MAFRKTSVGVTPPKPVDLPPPTVGEMKDGMVWDGEKWIPESDWKEAKSKSAE